VSLSFFFSSFCHFSCLLLALWFPPLLDDLLELLLAFGLLVVLLEVLDSKFKFCAFWLSMHSSRGGLRNQVVSTLV
jgi:hypothetical protein